MLHYIIYLAFCTAAQAFSVYQPLDCLGDYQDHCGAVQLGCAAARCPPSACLPVPLPLPLSFPGPRPACVQANSQCNANLQTILTLLATLKNTGIVGDPIIPTNTTSPNCIPLDKLIQLLIISNSTITFQNLVDLGIIPRDSAPSYLLKIRVSNLLTALLLPFNNNSTSGSGGLLVDLLGGGDNSLLGALGPALLAPSGLLGGLLNNILGGLGGGGSGGVVPPASPPGISKEQFNTLILQLIANLAGGCPPGSIPTLPPCPVPC